MYIIICSFLASKEASFYTSLASASLTSVLIDACIKGQINASECQCSNQRQFCQINPNSTYVLASLITDALNVSENLQQKTRFQINQANKALGREVSFDAFFLIIIVLSHLIFRLSNE